MQQVSHFQRQNKARPADRWPIYTHVRTVNSVRNRRNFQGGTYNGIYHCQSGAAIQKATMAPDRLHSNPQDCDFLLTQSNTSNKCVNAKNADYLYCL
jgi:hypothetical protein